MKKVNAPVLRRRREDDLLIAIIGGEDIVIGFLFAGIGQTNSHTKTNNFAIIAPETTDEELTHKFTEIYHRKDIGLLLIEKDLAQRIYSARLNTSKMLPIILEIPGKSFKK